MKTVTQSKVCVANFLEKLVKEWEEQGFGNRHRCISKDGRYIYHIAIIDYLQAFDVEKRAENLIKVWLYQRDGALISACDPKPYARRFNKFMRENVVVD